MERIGLLVIVFILTVCLQVYSGTPPVQEELTPCPDKPNCVSSQSTDRQHAISPIKYEGSRENARQDLLNALSEQKRVKVVSVRENYIHAEFTSALFRFVDDVEFLFDNAAKVIHVRSASRIGYSDLGVNRRRVEMLRARFEKMNALTPQMPQDIH